MLGHFKLKQLFLLFLFEGLAITFMVISLTTANAEQRSYAIVDVATNSTVVLEGAENVRRYQYDKIPGFSVEQGKALRFRLHDARTACARKYSLRVEVDGAEVTSSGLFSYVASSHARADKVVAIESKCPDEAPETFEFRISHVPSAEEQHFGYKRAIPDPSAPEYTAIVQRQIEEDRTLNGVSQRPVEIEIAGKWVVFDSTNARSNLHSRFHGRRDLAKLKIYAERVLVIGEVRFPGSELQIYAKELVFEDIGDQPTDIGRIVTTPYPRDDVSAAARNGIAGERGGSMSIATSRVLVTNAANKRLDATGGTGQSAGVGIPGNAGKSITPLSRIAYHIPGYGCSRPNLVYDLPRRDVTHVDLAGRASRLCRGLVTGSRDYFVGPAHVAGTTEWPGNGSNATPAGKPGIGGDGGDIVSTIPDANGLVIQNGGQSGAIGQETAGGPPGQPNPAYHYRFTESGWVSRASHTASPGANAPAPSPDAPHGNTGSFSTSIPHSDAWLNSRWLYQSVAHIRDAYINGNQEYVLSESRKYLSYIDEVNDLPVDEMQRLLGVKFELQAMILRIESGLDYFGNPAGWAPVLSFENNLDAFRAEIRQTISTLYLTHWLTARWNSNEDRVNGLRSAVSALEKEIAAGTAEFNKAQSDLKNLNESLIQVASDQAALQLELAEVERVLQAEAASTLAGPAWKEGFGKALVIAKSIPVFQPALNAIGNGVIALTENEPGALDTDSIAQDFEQTFSRSEFRQFANDAINKAQTSDAPEKWFKDLARYGEAVDKLSEGLKAKQIPKTEFDKILEELKAEHPIYRKVSSQLRDLGTTKATLLGEISSSENRAAENLERVTSSRQAILETQESLSSAISGQDLRVFQHIERLKERAERRLLFYHYDLAKAYEYRTVSEYPGTITLEGFLDRFITVATGADATQSLSSEQFDSFSRLFEDGLADVIRQLWEELNLRPPELSSTFVLGLSEKELSDLNTAGKAVINLFERGLLDEKHDAARISSLEIADLDFEQSGAPLSDTALLNLIVKHDNAANITRNGRIYRFRFTRNDGRLPRWGATLDTLSDAPDALQQTAPSLAERSLIAALLDKIEVAGLNSHSRLIHFRPSAWSDLEILSTVLPLGGPPIDIDRLRIKVTIDFIPPDDKISILRVSSGGDRNAEIRTVNTDIGGSSDGFGNFTRFYSADSQIELEAPGSHSGQIFAGWFERGQLVSKNRTFSFDMSNSRFLEYVYE